MTSHLWGVRDLVTTRQWMMRKGQELLRDVIDERPLICFHTHCQIIENSSSTPFQDKKKMQLQTFFSHFLIFREYLHIQQCRFFVSLSECINLTAEYF